MSKKGPKKLKVKVENKKIIASKTLRLNRSVLDAMSIAEEKKRLFIKIAVAGFMVIFFAAWLFSLKYQFKANSNNNSQNSFNWEQTKAELDQAMSKVKKGIAEIKQIQATKPQNTLPRQPELTNKQIDLLKEKLITEAATGTASGAKK